MNYPNRKRAGGGRRVEAVCLLAATVASALGFALVFMAKARNFPAVARDLAEGRIVHLGRIASPDRLEPALLGFAPPDRTFVAGRIIEYLRSRKDPLPNVGALTSITVPASAIAADPEAGDLKKGVEKLPEGVRLRLVTASQLRAMKSALVVRDPRRFQADFALWSGLLLAAFWSVHLAWSRLRFEGDQLILPALLVLTGVGLVLAVSLRDPLRDTELFASSAQGMIGGCGILLFASRLDFQKRFARLTFLPLVLSFVLSVLLLVFGSGPGASDAKVNLGPFQPVEVMRVCLVFFLAGYFGRRWQLLRELKERRPAFSGVGRYLRLPKLDHLLPVLGCVGFALLFFFLQRDLGPALLLTCLFLSLYALARGGFGLAAGGLAVLAGGVVLGYLLGTPKTVVGRIDMFRSPWDNQTRGGDQLVGSFWALASGGVLGSGPGLGEPSIMPAAHTDLILAAAGEEMGFAGVLAVFACWGVLLYRGARIASRASTPYLFFLTSGCVLATAFQILLIAAGILGLAPLSGVVSPFLSYGRTAMLANFGLAGVLTAVSASPIANAEVAKTFGKPLGRLMWVLTGLFAIVIGRFGYLQVVVADDIATTGAMVRQQDGVRRLQYNPRLVEVVRELGRGSILDRNGLPLATSRWDELVAHREDYRSLGIDLEQCCRRSESRHYPLGAVTFHLLGDIRDHRNWQAANSSYVEREYEDYLRGFSDRPAPEASAGPDPARPPGYHNYRDLLPLLRHRYQPDYPEVRAIHDRVRNLRLTVDAGLTVRAAQILRRQLKGIGRDRGAVVVLDPHTGDVLALVSVPSEDSGACESGSQDAEGSLFDRARFGLYPPGSVFKLVTAAAALRTDPASDGRVYACERLPDGRVGAVVRGAMVRDDESDKNPHGPISMATALARSCNAYFAQLAVEGVGAKRLFETARMLGIRIGSPDTQERLQKTLAQAGYGQGEVVATPLQVGRLAAMVANNGILPTVRLTSDQATGRSENRTVLSHESAEVLARAMRLVVTDGTGTKALLSPAAIAGKTGTAEVSGAASHAWFAGFAPAELSATRHIAFAVFLENGKYGGAMAAPVAAELVAAAVAAGIIP